MKCWKSRVAEIPRANLGYLKKQAELTPLLLPIHFTLFQVPYRTPCLTIDASSPFLMPNPLKIPQILVSSPGSPYASGRARRALYSQVPNQQGKSQQGPSEGKAGLQGQLWRKEKELGNQSLEPTGQVIKGLVARVSCPLPMLLEVSSSDQFLGSWATSISCVL